MSCYVLYHTLNFSIVEPSMNNCSDLTNIPSSLHISNICLMSEPEVLINS